MWVFEPLCCDGCEHFSWEYYWIDDGQIQKTKTYPEDYYSRVDRYGACDKKQNYVEGLPGRRRFCKLREGTPFVTLAWLEQMLRYPI